MATVEKQSDSEKYKSLVLATLDYLINNYTGEIVFDGVDPILEYYEYQKIQAQKYRSQGNRSKLQEQLDRLTQTVINKVDLNFTQYIKAQTGYDLDIYAELRKLSSEILLRGAIQNDTESLNVMNLLRLYNTTKEDPQKEKTLQGLLDAFHESKRLSGQSHASIVSSVVKDGLITETVEFSSGRKPKHHKHRMISSPDSGKRLFIYEWSHGKQASTSINILFKTTSGGIYQVEGIHPEMDAYWKDNNTVVIQTSKSYVVQLQHRTVQSFSEVVSIKYVEK